MENTPSGVAILKQLKELGIKLAIDDFGTGYSSLSYLKRLPVDLLKIDGSFVDGLGRDPEDRSIVSAVIDLAHTLGLQVVAEGVEIADQLAHLRETGYELAQENYFSKPLPGEAAGTLLADGPG
jgi:EAL domain-containing protein (putative c-di-GMP-specific phosphodiesterase class I)